MGELMSVNPAWKKVLKNRLENLPPHG